MGPNSFRNLTYAAVLLVVGSLVYLIYKSSNKGKISPSTETAGLSTYSEPTASLSGSGATPDMTTSSQDGQLVSGAASDANSISAPMAPSLESKTTKATEEVKEVIAEEANSLSSDLSSDAAIASSTKKVNVKSGSQGEKPLIASKGVKSKAKFDAGSTKGDYMVVAGAFSSKDNADALVAKLKKMGFAKAEAVKLENSANTYAIAGHYEFKGGADAAVRTLKAKKIEALVKKRDGEIYRAAPAPVASPKAPTKPASSFSKPI